MQLLSQNRDVMNNAYTVDSTMGRPMFLLVGRYIISQVVLLKKKLTNLKNRYWVSQLNSKIPLRPGPAHIPVRL